MFALILVGEFIFLADGHSAVAEDICVLLGELIYSDFVLSWYVYLIPTILCVDFGLDGVVEEDAACQLMIKGVRVVKDGRWPIQLHPWKHLNHYDFFVEGNIDHDLVVENGLLGLITAKTVGLDELNDEVGLMIEGALEG